MIGRRAVLVLALSTLFACEKADKAGAKASGPLGADDVALLKQIPGGNVALVGGNYMKMQNFMSTALGKGVVDLAQQGAAISGSQIQGDMQVYMACFAEIKSMRMAGGASLGDGGLTIRMAMGGVTLAQIQACAEKGKQKTTLDPDGKYLSIEAYAPGGTMSTTIGYLASPGGAIIMRMTMGLPAMGGTRQVVTAARAELEADAAAAAKSSANDDSALISQLATLDRTKTMWFAGNGKGTSLATKLGALSGTMDLTSGLAIDATVQLTDSSLASQVDMGMGQVKQMKGKLPAEYRSIIDTIKYSRSGDKLHFAASMTDAQIGALMKQMSAMAGMRGY